MGQMTKKRTADGEGNKGDNVAGIWGNQRCRSKMTDAQDNAEHRVPDQQIQQTHGEELLSDLCTECSFSISLSEKKSKELTKKPAFLSKKT